MYQEYKKYQVRAAIPRDTLSNVWIRMSCSLLNKTNTLKPKAKQSQRTLTENMNCVKWSEVKGKITCEELDKTGKLGNYISGV